MRQTLKTTTALLASLALIVPLPVVAQDATSEETVVCPEGTEDCAPTGGADAEPSNGDADSDGVEEPTPEAAGEPSTETPIEAQAEPAEPAGDPADPTEGSESEETPADEDGAAEVETEQEESSEAVVPPAEDQGGVAPAGSDEGSLPVEDAAAEEASDQEAETPPPAQDASEAQDGPDADANEQTDNVVADDAATSDAETGETSTDQDPAPTQPDTPEAEPDAASAAPADEAATALPMEDATGTEPDADDEQTETIADKNGDEEPVETPQAAAVAADSDSAGDVETEVIAEDDVRTSDQDFATAISNDEDADDDDDGLSNLEKALLLGAGAVAVGALLSNNRQVVARSDDRIVVSDPTGGYQLLKDDNALLRQPGNEVRTETFDDGSTRTTITREDGSRIVTIRDNELRVLQRSRIAPDGTETLLIDDTAETRPVNRAALTATAAAPSSDYRPEDLEGLRSALAEQGVFDRSYSLSQVRRIAEVRRQVPAVDLDNITFQTASAAITPEQADELASLGRFIRDSIEDDPSQVFLVEGHTDAVGDAAYNLALSDRRAESVALALTEYFNVPPENLVVQGYGEQFLRIDTQEAERANRRATIRNITPLLRTARND